MPRHYVENTKRYDVSLATRANSLVMEAEIQQLHDGKDSKNTKRATKLPESSIRSIYEGEKRRTSPRQGELGGKIKILQFVSLNNKTIIELGFRMIRMKNYSASIFIVYLSLSASVDSTYLG